MHVLVVYESMFGNTQQIASAVAEGLTPYARLDLSEVSDAATGDLAGDIDLLVVGGPTHAMGLSRPGSRQSAKRQAADGVVSQRTGLREWLTEIYVRRRLATAAFDTRFDKPVLLVGSAARGAGQAAAPVRLRGHCRTREFLRHGELRPATRGRARAGAAMGSLDGRAGGVHSPEKSLVS